MGAIPSHTNNKLIYHRLVALWVVGEAFVGGIIHGLHLPVSGLVVGGVAIVCIAMMAYYEPEKGAILKATLVVAIFKMMLSPQAPPMAYVAVFFQGLLGELLFWRRRMFAFACLLLAVLAMLESALQRLLVLTIIYGNGFWKALNLFLGGLTGNAAPVNYSRWICIAYIVIHLLAGLVIGIGVARLPAALARWKAAGVLPVIRGQAPEKDEGVKRRKRTIFWLVLWLILLALYLQSYYHIGRPLVPAGALVQLLWRSLIILLAWYFLVGPLVKWLLHRWLQRQRGRLKDRIDAVTDILPGIHYLLRVAWRHAIDKKRPVSFFCKTVLVNLLGNEQVVIFSKPIGSGKTTALAGKMARRADVWGVLTPVVDGRRKFRLLPGGQETDMEAKEGEVEIPVGRFRFSAKGFEAALVHLRAIPGDAPWIIIDEIGPLELRNEGFATVLNAILQTMNDGQMLLLVVREGLVQQVADHFSISSFRLVTDADLL